MGKSIIKQLWYLKRFDWWRQLLSFCQYVEFLSNSQMSRFRHGLYIPWRCPPKFLKITNIKQGAHSNEEWLVDTEHNTIRLHEKSADLRKLWWTIMTYPVRIESKYWMPFANSATPIKATNNSNFIFTEANFTCLQFNFMWFEIRSQRE